MRPRASVFVQFALVLLLSAAPGIPADLQDQTPPERGQSSPIGTLEVIGEGLPRRGQWRNSFAVADMNQDGVLDLVHGPARKSLGQPVIFLGDGKGGFKRWATASFPPLPYDYGVVTVADFDGDGRPVDIALGSHLRGITVLLGDGQGKFTEWRRGLEFRVPDRTGEVPFCAGALVALDWNRDGRMDLAAVPEGPSRVALRAGRAAPAEGLRVFLNLPDVWYPLALGPTGEFLIGSSLAAGDINGDGRPDLLTGSSAFGFTKLVRLNPAPEGGAEGSVGLPVPARAFVTAVALADFDKNGRSDPVVAFSVLEGTTWSHRVEVHLSSSGRFQTSSVTRQAEKSAFRALAAGDLDRDGRMDLAAVQEDGSLRLYRMDPDGAFTLSLSEPAPAWRRRCPGYDVHLADLDGDQSLEIIASFAGESTGISLEPTIQSGGGIQAWRLSR